MTATAALEAPPALEAVDLPPKKGRWRLELSPDRIRGDRDDGTSFQVSRAEMTKRALLVDNFLARHILLIRKPAKQVLKLEEGAYRAIEAWAGKDLLLQMALRQRFSWVLPIGILLLLASLPVSPDPQSGIAGSPFNLVNAILGGSLVIQSLLARAAPHRVYLLLDSIWFLIIAADTTRAVITTQASPVWVPLIGLQVWLAISGIQRWRRFGDPLLS